jgi:LPXTG-motif cell wall-anchored protein
MKAAAIILVATALMLMGSGTSLGQNQDTVRELDQSLQTEDNDFDMGWIGLLGLLGLGGLLGRREPRGLHYTPAPDQPRRN